MSIYEQIYNCYLNGERDVILHPSAAQMDKGAYPNGAKSFELKFCYSFAVPVGQVIGGSQFPIGTECFGYGTIGYLEGIKS